MYLFPFGKWQRVCFSGERANGRPAAAYNAKRANDHASVIFVKSRRSARTWHTRPCTTRWCSSCMLGCRHKRTHTSRGREHAQCISNGSLLFFFPPLSLLSSGPHGQITRFSYCCAFLFFDEKKCVLFGLCGLECVSWLVWLRRMRWAVKIHMQLVYRETLFCVTWLGLWIII